MNPFFPVYRQNAWRAPAVSSRRGRATKPGQRAQGEVRSGSIRRGERRSVGGGADGHDFAHRFAEVSPAGGRAMRILIVEDDDTLGDLLLTHLTELGH